MDPHENISLDISKLMQTRCQTVTAGTEAKQADLIWVFVEELYELLVEDAAASGVSHR